MDGVNDYWEMNGKGVGVGSWCWLGLDTTEYLLHFSLQ